MTRLLKMVPIAGVVVCTVTSKMYGHDVATLRLTTLLISPAVIMAVLLLQRKAQASPIHKGMAGFVILAALAVWAWPEGGGQLLSKFPAAGLFTVLFLVAIVPPLLGRDVFTLFFARKSTPEVLWETEIFARINHRLTWFWAGLFFLGAFLSAVPGVFELQGPVYAICFEGLLPAALMLGVGLPVTKSYPGYYQRKMGDVGMKEEKVKKPGGERAESQNKGKIGKKEGDKMFEKPTVVAVNGSPHVGFGNTSMMIEMFRRPLSEEGFDLEAIHLSEKRIEYCTGCALCMEKGKCWIEDDHRKIVKKLLEADGVILASPVYFLHVTAQMKTFIDRSLAFGHKPRPTWKPGLAISVSAGLGMKETADYLGFYLRAFGSFPLGTLTALAVGPGEFTGRAAVEARANDLAHDLARAVKEKRRYPATDQDLHFYQFMGSLIRSQKDSMMKHDFEHWEEHGFYEGFEAYIQQTTDKPLSDAGLREAWVKKMIDEQKEKRKSRSGDKKQPQAGGPETARTCKELLQIMPAGFNPAQAEGLKAIYQFEVSGDENFVAHLDIDDGICTYHDGAAASPGVVIKTPADVWLAVSRGKMDGQQAFMTGRYKVEGDLGLLLKLKALFSR